MRIALAQINTTVGDFTGNSGLIVKFAQQAKAQEADLVVFPEMALCGYPPRDLVEKPSFENAELEKEWRGPYLGVSDLKDNWGTDLKYKLEETTDTSGTTSKRPRVWSCGPNKTDDNGDGDDIKNQAWADETAATK